MTMATEKTTTPSLGMITHMRGNWLPPLPLEYAAWADRLIEIVNAAGGVQYAEWDQDVTVPADVVEVGPLPRLARQDDDGTWAVRLGDIVEALKIYDVCYDSDADAQDDTDGDTDAAHGDTAGGGAGGRCGCGCAHCCQ